MRGQSVGPVEIKTHTNCPEFPYTNQNKIKQTAMPNAPKTQRKQLTDLQRGAILALKEEKQSQHSIAEKLKIPRPTIENFLKRFRIHGTHENLPRSGRPHLTTPHKDQELHDTVITQPRIKYNALRELLNLKISTRTIRQRLQAEHIRK